MTPVKAKKSQFPEMEEAVLKFWSEAKIFEQSTTKEAPAGDYVFYDGPPFATGTPHYGHLVASLMKDVVPRFWTMNGYRVERQWGWDCHGLPIENIVEKELGTKSKKDIEAMGVAKFNELCRSKVLGYAKDWEKTISRLGRWVDFEHGYKTMDLNYMESVWWVFKQLWDKGLIYEGYRSMHICPRCETTLSQSEVAEGYKDIKDLSATVKFELVEQPGTFVLAWTTTPWTLIGNVALAVGADIDYVVAEIEKQNLKVILAKDRAADVLKEIEFTIISEIKGHDLTGKKYRPLFNYYAQDTSLINRERGWQIYAADFVTTEEGTGVVHIAPAFGEDDLELGRQAKLPFVQHVGMDGLIKPEVTDFAGLSVKPIDDHTKTDVAIIKYLAHHDLLFDKAKYEHSYPHCWRCDTPLLNYATSSWFVNVTKIKDTALATAQDITWSPEHIKEGRFGQWLAGARDWSISRQRFWASVLPIWKCEKCNELEVFGSVADLEKRSGIKVGDLHKHIVDTVMFPCTKCGFGMKRVPDVLDTWFDSGSMPYAQKHYPFSDKKEFEANFPAEFIAEGVDQTRAWFYYLHVIANGIFGQAAFQKVIVNGIVQAEDGKKMSKKLNNYPDPNEVLDHYGADALRAYLLASPVMQAENLNFSEREVEESLRKNLMILWNVYKFYETYASSQAAKLSPIHVLDKWILAKLNQLIAEVSQAMANYNLPKAIRPITVFIDELSTWYLRRSRDRFKSDDQADKEQALATLKFVLIELAKVMAPFMPFLAETLWQKVAGYNFADKQQSVHLAAWPQAAAVDESIVVNMEMTRQAVELTLAKRDEAGIKVRQPLPKLMLKNCSLDQAYLDLIKDEVNVKEVACQFGEAEMVVELDTKISEELAAEGLKRELVRAINALRKKAGLSVNDRVEIFIGCEHSDSLKAMIALYNSEIIKETIGSKLEVKALSKDLLISEEVNINGHQVLLGLKQ